MVDVSSGRRMPGTPFPQSKWRRQPEATVPLYSGFRPPARPYTPLPAQYADMQGITGHSPTAVPTAINPYQGPPAGSLLPPGAIPGTYNPVSNSALADAPSAPGANPGDTPSSPVKGSGNGLMDFTGRLGDAFKSFTGNGTAPVYDTSGKYLGYDPSSPDNEQGLGKLVNMFKFFQM